MANLNKVMTYVRENEFTNRIKIVTLLPDGAEVPSELLTDISVLNRAYPDIDIEFVTRAGRFGPEFIDEVSREWKHPQKLHVHRLPRRPVFPTRCRSWAVCG